MATSFLTHHVEEVASTQDAAVSLSETAGDVPLLLVAERQTKGRGRTGHSWLTAPRAVACTLVVAPTWRPDRAGTVPLAAGLAARGAIRDHTGVAPRLKWPNDLIVGHGKIGGLLVQASGDVVAIGFGANLWWPEPPAGMAAVCDEDPGANLARQIASTWAERLLTRLGGGPAAWGRDEYRAACETLGKVVTWEPSGRGRAIDVAPDGALIVATDRGRETLRSGEVRTLRDATLSPEDHTGGSPQ